MHSWIDETSLITKRETRTRFRLRIFESFHCKCAYCGEHAESLDHVVPRHRGGQTVIENLVPACLRCNGTKGSTEWTLWYRQQDFYTLHREIVIWEWLYQFKGLVYSRKPECHCCNDQLERMT